MRMELNEEEVSGIKRQWSYKWHKGSKASPKNCLVNRNIAQLVLFRSKTSDRIYFTTIHKSYDGIIIVHIQKCRTNRYSRTTSPLTIPEERVHRSIVKRTKPNSDVIMQLRHMS
ncbi:uncharacterized protein LOC143909619 [Arctopsyche grandis]|uniref:uncharacterized protein LOC143909619 n=1 Tax=Arctopsyche grandis TaxID=121162 RepID=UPI00406D72CF